MAVVVGSDLDSLHLRSFVAQLIERGVYFTMDDQQRPLTRLPERLDDYRAVALDDAAARQALADPQARQRLERYARDVGVVFPIDDLSEATGSRVYRFNGSKVAIDMTMTARVFDIMAHAALTSPHPQAVQRQLDRDDRQIFAELKADVMRYLADPRPHWGEYHCHYWKTAVALAAHGHEDVRQPLIDTIRQAGRKLGAPIHHDRIAGYFATVWLRDQTGEEGPMREATRMIDQLLARRPRHMGVVGGAGFTDDPLGLGPDTSIDSAFEWGIQRRFGVWTEFLHFHGPSFAAMTRATGDRRYLDEALRLIEFIRRYHLRPDGVLTHVTRDGKAVGGAWGRGQSHALYGLVYTLDELPPNDPARQPVIELISRVGHGLLPYQDGQSGLWRNLVDNPQARLETSSTVGIAYALSRGVREGWLDRATFEPVIRRAWRGLRQMYWRGGFCAQCRGTSTGDDWYYLSRPQGWAVIPQAVMVMLQMQAQGPGVTSPESGVA
jgi:hypothetical protein